MSPQDYIAQGRTSGVPRIRQAAPAAAPIEPRPLNRQAAQIVQRIFKAGENDRLVAGWSGTPRRSTRSGKSDTRTAAASSRLWRADNPRGRLTRRNS